MQTVIEMDLNGPGTTPTQITPAGPVSVDSGVGDGSSETAARPLCPGVPSNRTPKSTFHGGAMNQIGTKCSQGPKGRSLEVTV